MAQAQRTPLRRTDGTHEYSGRFAQTPRPQLRCVCCEACPSNELADVVRVLSAHPKLEKLHRLTPTATPSAQQIKDKLKASAASFGRQSLSHAHIKDLKLPVAGDFVFATIKMPSLEVLTLRSPAVRLSSLIHLDKLSASRTTDLSLRELELDNVTLPKPADATDLFAFLSATPQLRRLVLDVQLKPDAVSKVVNLLSGDRKKVTSARQPLQRLSSLSLGPAALDTEEPSSPLSAEVWQKLVTALPALENLERLADEQDEDTWKTLRAFLKANRPGVLLRWRYHKYWSMLSRGDDDDVDRGDSGSSPKTPKPKPRRKKGTKAVCELGVESKASDLRMSCDVR